MVPVALTIEPRSAGTPTGGPPIAADELEAVVLLALLDREAAESDVDRLALLRRGRQRLERQLGDLLAA